MGVSKLAVTVGVLLALGIVGAAALLAQPVPAAKSAPAVVAVAAPRVAPHVRVRARVAGDALAFAPDGKAFSDGAAVWDAATGKKLLDLADPGTPRLAGAEAVTFSPDGTLVATGHCPPVVCVWDRATGKLLREFGGQRREESSSGTPVVRCLVFAPDGKSLATGDTHGTLRLWEVRTGKELCTFDKVDTGYQSRHGGNGYILSAAFAPDGRTLLTTGINRPPALRLWEVATGKQRGVLEGHTQDAARVTFAADGRTVLAVSLNPAGPVLRWDATTGKLRSRFGAKKGSIQGVAVSADARRVALGGVFEDPAVIVYDADTGKNLARLEDAGAGHSLKLAFTPDGKSLAALRWNKAAYKTDDLVIWDLSGLRP